MNKIIVVDGNDGLGKSTLVQALQGMGYTVSDRGIPTNMTDTDGLQPVDGEVYIILDAPIEVSQARLLKAGKSLDEPYHNEADLRHYRQRFLEVIEQLGNQCVKIDASGTPEEVLTLTLVVLNERGVTQA